jgi:hypothetical protein
MTFIGFAPLLNRSVTGCNPKLRTLKTPIAPNMVLHDILCFVIMGMYPTDHLAWCSEDILQKGNPMSDPHRPEHYGGYQPDQQPYQPPYQSPYQPYQIQYQQASGYQAADTKPSEVLIIGIMAIADAVISGMSSLFWIITICGIPFGIYSIVVAVMAGMYAYKLLSNPPQPVQPNKTLAILQIVNIITGNVFSLIFGIVSLVLYNQPKVQAYFAYRNGQPLAPHQYQPPPF